MSLDVYLDSEDAAAEAKNLGIFIRRDGQTIEISREEWDRLYPNREPVVMQQESDSRRVYAANITHNLGAMADAAGIYKACWRPDEISVSKACQLIPLLADGLAKLRAEPEKFKSLNPSNGWGTYDGLVVWVEAYLDACKKYPDATVLVSR